MEVRSRFAQVREMLSDITAGFSELVHALRWMDSVTKIATLDKAAAIKAFIGYPDWLLEDGELERFYEGVSMDRGQFLWNMLNMKGREVKGLLGALAPKDEKDAKTKDRWATDPIEVNAFYSRAINSIGESSPIQRGSIPAGVGFGGFRGVLLLEEGSGAAVFLKRRGACFFA